MNIRTVKRTVKKIVPSFLENTAKRYYSCCYFLKLWLSSILNMRHLDLKMDTNNVCNIECKYCYRFSQEEQESNFMTVEQFERVAHELFPISERVALACATEPLMSKHFIKFLDIAEKYNIPNLTYITNGLLLTDEIIEKTIECGVKEVAISIDAATEDLYEEICKNASFAQIINNLKQIYELKRKYNSKYPFIRIAYTVFEENIRQVPLFIEKYHQYFDTISLNHMLSRMRNERNPYNRVSKEQFMAMERQSVIKAKKKGIEIETTFNDIRPKPFLCHTAINYRLVKSNGDVYLCNKEIVGNIFINTYKDIVKTNTPVFKELYRAKHNYCTICGS